jgi:hypothetical protein
MNDPVVEQVRTAREHLAQAAGFDIHTIAQNARLRDENSGASLITRPRRIPVAQQGRYNAMHPSGASAVSGVENSSTAAG